MSFFRLTPGVASSVFFWSLWHLAQTISENLVDCGVLIAGWRLGEDICCRNSEVCMYSTDAEDLFLGFYAAVLACGFVSSVSERFAPELAKYGKTRSWDEFCIFEVRSTNNVSHVPQIRTLK